MKWVTTSTVCSSMFYVNNTALLLKWNHCERLRVQATCTCIIMYLTIINIMIMVDRSTYSYLSSLFISRYKWWFQFCRHSPQVHGLPLAIGVDKILLVFKFKNLSVDVCLNYCITGFRFILKHLLGTFHSNTHVKFSFQQFCRNWKFTEI